MLGVWLDVFGVVARTDGTAGTAGQVVVCINCPFTCFDLMITYIALFSALLSRLTALACGST